jgi:hypothetical protein
MLFGEIFVNYENDTKLINTFCGQNAELLNVKVGDACSYTVLKRVVDYKPIDQQISVLKHDGRSVTAQWITMRCFPSSVLVSQPCCISSILSAAWNSCFLRETRFAWPLPNFRGDCVHLNISTRTCTQTAARFRPVVTKLFRTTAPLVT